MKIQHIRNATTKLTINNTTFLIDPWLQDQGTGMCCKTVNKDMEGVKSPLDKLTLSIEDILEDVDYYLLTHHHPDHYTKDYLDTSIPFITQDDKDLDKVKLDGFDGLTFKENSLNVNDIQIIKVEGIHGDNVETVNKCGKVSGYIIQAKDHPTIYIAGDTIYYDKVEENIKKYNPDIIFLNCCKATMPIGRLIMDDNDVLEVLKHTDAQVILVHLDSVNHSLLYRDDYRKLKEEKQLTQLIIPDNGEIVDI